MSGGDPMTELRDKMADHLAEEWSVWGRSAWRDVLDDVMPLITAALEAEYDRGVNDGIVLAAATAQRQRQVSAGGAGTEKEQPAQENPLT